MIAFQQNDGPYPRYRLTTHSVNKEGPMKWQHCKQLHKSSVFCYSIGFGLHSAPLPRLKSSWSGS